jgi:hypothetical protein
MNKKSIDSQLQRINMELVEGFTMGQKMDEEVYGPEGRKVIYRNFQNIPMNFQGTVSFRTIINREGDVVHCHIIEDGTTISDLVARREALKAAAGYKFESTT